MFRRVICPAIRLANGLVVCGAKHFDSLMMRTVLAAGMNGTELVGCELGYADQEGELLTREQAREVGEERRRARLSARQRAENKEADSAPPDKSGSELAPVSIIQENDTMTPKTFGSFKKTKYPPRQWGLVGFAGTGKSTFLAQLLQPLLVIDADGRFHEIADKCRDPLTLSDNPNDHRDGLAIATALQGAELSGIGTIVLDSITPILRLSIAMGMTKNERGEGPKNKVAAFQDKANQLRLIQDSMVRPGVDSVIVWHYEKGRDDKGQEQKNQTISRTEGERLLRSMNAIIALDKDENTGQRLAKVTWSRAGRRGIVIPDTEGFWRGVPERIEAALYD